MGVSAAEDRRGEPLAPWRAGCAGQGGKGHCNGRVKFAGLAYFTHSRQVWLAFVCAEHKWQLVTPRPLLDRDRAEIARRREALRRVTEDHLPYVKPQPLAVGREALALIENARKWASERGEHVAPGDGEAAGAGLVEAGEDDLVGSGGEADLREPG